MRTKDELEGVEVLLEWEKEGDPNLSVGEGDLDQIFEESDLHEAQKP